MASINNILAGFVFAVLGALTVVSGQTKVEPVTSNCLGCICEAVSNCNRNYGCTGDVCGLFHITADYWADAGRPTVSKFDDPNNITVYLSCTTDPLCAGTTVSNYLKKYAQDCNGDGVVNCYDYASIHRLGGYGCSGDLEIPSQERFIKCQKLVTQFGGGF